MARFIRKVAVFFTPLCLLVLIGVLLPATPRERTSLLFAATQKNSRLKNVGSPRLILVGGSNLSFGIDSAAIEKEFEVNVINTGLHASLGLKYMLENTERYIREGDVVVVVPEYDCFGRPYDFASTELLRLVLDVDRSSLQLLSVSQLVNLIRHVPQFALSKYSLREYRNVKPSGVYSVNSFNEYGDAVAHWSLPSKQFDSDKGMNTDYLDVVVDELERFATVVEGKSARLLFCYPCFEEDSFDNCVDSIDRVHRALELSGVKVLSEPKRYRFPGEMMFDTVYHLNKSGVDVRTRRLIEDCRPYMTVAQNSH